MKIRTIEDLRRIRAGQRGKVLLRESSVSDEHTAEIAVGMGSCGLAAGARETINAFVSEIVRRALDHVRVVQVDCMGHCASEPTVRVTVPGMPTVLYGRVTPSVAVRILEEHVIGGRPIERIALNRGEGQSGGGSAGRESPGGGLS